MPGVADDDDAGFPADLDDFDDLGERPGCCVVDGLFLIRYAGHKDRWGQYLMVC